MQTPIRPDHYNSEPADEFSRPLEYEKMRRPSEESLRTEFCEGPVLDPPMENASPGQTNNIAIVKEESHTSDRAELIERIKKGEAPTWIPNRRLQDFLDSQSTPSPSLDPHDHLPPEPSQLLPAAEVTENRDITERNADIGNDGGIMLNPASEIKRPRSALHAGDFREELGNPERTQEGSVSPTHPNQAFEDSLDASHASPWYAPSEPASSSVRADPGFPASNTPAFASSTPVRLRAPSLTSFSSSYVLKAPTSPLVHQSNNAELDFSPQTSTAPNIFAPSLDTFNRRHTLPTHLLDNLNWTSNPISPPHAQRSHPIPNLRRDATVPYQTHRPRRSLNNWTLQAASSPQTPAWSRTRRPSYSEPSPLQHASMVGSYEESILRGRMSTNPSKPLDFTAQIGVLGTGDCKPNLKCPAHITVPFPAVFYSWGNGSNRDPSLVGNEPSPYVGHIDLENSLIPHTEDKERRKQRHISLHDRKDIKDSRHTQERELSPAARIIQRKRGKRKQGTDLPKTPPGGSYRLPQRGQLQIIIKNPNKTAVKLFLVPYDLQDMQPYTKTFIRQRCYSTGSNVYDALSSTRGTVSEDGRVFTEPKSKPTLRYLIHLNICSTSRGRYFLYQHIRVVFANRVPDGKEKLENETQLPEPRYSAYKPGKDSVGPTISSAGAKLAADKAYRRRSAGIGFGPASYDAMDGVTFTGGGNHLMLGAPSFPIPPLPSNLVRSRQEEHDSPSNEDETNDIETPVNNGELSGQNAIRYPLPAPGFDHSFARRPIPVPFGSSSSPTSGVSSHRSDSSHGSDNGYAKLSKGDAGYGGIFGNRAGSPGRGGDGLLARRLKGLEVDGDGWKGEDAG